jgi:metallo-beta-lactamase class B
MAARMNRPGRGLGAALGLLCVLATAACGTTGVSSAGSIVPAGDRVVRINSELAVRRIAEGAFVVTHEPAFDSNVLVVRMVDGTVVICSSPFDTQATRTMLWWIRAALAPGRIIAINTHFHPDGTAGNEAYAEAGVETYATDLTQRLLAERGAQIREGAAAAMNGSALASRVLTTRIVPATHTIKAAEGAVFTFGSETVRVIYPGPAHSPDNIVVHFPARGILFGGCMIKTGSSIGNTDDADLGHWEAAVRSVETLGARVVVPGHGPDGGPETFRNTLVLVKAARS